MELTELHLMPHMPHVGPYYPGMLPVPADNIKFMGRPVLEVFLKYGKKPTDAYTPGEFEFLKQYVAYYLNAPCWDLPQEFRNKALNISTIEEFEAVVSEALDFALDVF